MAPTIPKHPLEYVLEQEAYTKMQDLMRKLDAENPQRLEGRKEPWWEKDLKG